MQMSFRLVEEHQRPLGDGFHQTRHRQQDNRMPRAETGKDLQGSVTVARTAEHASVQQSLREGADRRFEEVRVATQRL